MPGAWVQPSTWHGPIRSWLLCSTPCFERLIDLAWDLVRAIDAEPEGAVDIDHLERARSLGRVLIANNRHMRALAERWLDEGTSFPGLLWWHRKNHALMSNAEILEAIEEITRGPNSFAYPIEFIKPKR